MSDVAREAGVALGTVSKVINGQPVGESYRLRVEAAVKKAGLQDQQQRPLAKDRPDPHDRLHRAQHHHALFRAADASY